MAKFKKKGSGELPEINTSSLPDIVFMLLFFFMVATTMREVTLNVSMLEPNATEITKLQEKSVVTVIYVGTPKPQFKNTYGTDSRIQLNDAFATVDEIGEYISSKREEMGEKNAPKMIVNLKMDHGSKMGIITDIKQALRKAQALKINYSARQAAPKK